MICRASGHAEAEDAEQDSASDPEGHRNRDRGKRRHGACPLPEHREVEKGAAGKQGKAYSPETIAERRGDPDNCDPRQRRRELHGG